MNHWKAKFDLPGVKLFVCTIKRYHVMYFSIFLFLAAFFVLWANNKSEAGAISNISASLSNSEPSATATYTVTFTPATTIPADGYIYVEFQREFSSSTTVPSAPSKESGTSSAISSFSQSTSYVVQASLGSQISGGTETTLKIGGLTNPQAGRYYLTIWTTDSGLNALDGSNSPTSSYRAYYTVGTPVVMGRILDPDGNPMSNSWVNVSSSYNASPGSMYSYTYYFGGDSTDDQGYYSIGSVSASGSSSSSALSSGTQLKISAYAPPEQYKLGWSSDETITYEGATITKNIQFVAPTKTISGTVTFSNGDPVTSARVSFWSVSGSGWTEATTDSNGQYSVKVKGGKWQGMPSSEWNSNWTYRDDSSSISFSNDTSAESQTLNFKVKRINSVIAGSVRLPDGSIPSDPSSFYVSVWSTGMGGGNGQQLDTSGNFSITLSEGTYMVSISSGGSSQDYAAPDMDSVTVSEGETKNLGTITLQERTATISGRVVDRNGNGIANIKVNAYKVRGSGWAESTSDASGNFTMKVFPGKWMAYVMLWGWGSNSSESGNYVLDGTIPEVKVGARETASITITLAQANATISGAIVDASGNVVADMWGWVYAEKSGSTREDNFWGSSLGGSADRGQFSFKVPSGTYTIGLGPMPGSSYSVGDAVNVTVADNATATQNITVYQNDMTITGSIKDENGNTVTGAFMEVYATNKTGGWQNAYINQADGTYNMKVSSAVDPWNLGYHVDPSLGYFPEALTENQVSGNSGDTITKDLTLRKADATVSGTVLDGDGNPMPYVYVYADNRGGDLERERENLGYRGPMFMNNNMTDLNGNFSINVPNGTYFAGASVPREQYSNLINPKRVEVTLSPNETKTGIVLAFTKADSVVTGTVTSNGTGQEAFVWAWSDQGGYNETETDENGNYTLNVTKNDNWHIGVNGDITDTTNYVKSSEVVIGTGDSTSITQNIEAEIVEDGLIEPMSTTFTPTSAKVANLSDGSMITVPANTMSTDSSITVTLSAASTSELPRTIDSKPVGTGLDLTAIDNSGNSLTSFNSSLSVTMPYDETILDDLQVTEDDLRVCYWDETNGIWQPLDTYSIDKENNQVIFSTNHFTIFAVVSDVINNDVTVSEDNPPVTTTGTRATVKSWEAERYRSPSGIEKLKLVLNGRHFKKDAEVTIGGKTADSVKISKQGNRLVAKFKMKKFGKIRPNKLRVIRVINPDAESRRASRKINLNNVDLRVAYVSSSELNTSTDAGIRNIQTLLFNINYLKKSEITGTFGPITRDAVIRFQRDHDLPATGNIGPLTRAKLNERNGK